MSTINQNEEPQKEGSQTVKTHGRVGRQTRLLVLRSVIAAITVAFTLAAVGTPTASGASAKRASKVRSLPDLVIDAPEATVVPGQVFNVRVLLTSSTSAVIRYTLTGLPSGTSTKFSTINGRERRLQIGIPASANPGTYQARFRTTNPGTKRTDTFLVNVSGPTPTIPPTVVTVPPTTIATITPQFQIATAVPERFLRIGNSTSFRVEVTRQNQWVGPVNLVVEGLPTGTNAGFLPYNPTSEPSSEFRIVSSRTTPPGDYTLRIVGTAGDQTRVLPVLLKVRGPESISFGASINAAAEIGKTTRVGEVDVSVVNGDGEKVTFSADLVPAGLALTFGTNPTLGKTPVFATVAPNVAVGNYTFVLVARKGDATSKIYAYLTVVPNAPATLRYQVTAVPAVAGEALGYGLSTVLGSVVVNRGASTSILITIAPKGGYNSTIDFSVTGLPTGLVASLEPTSVSNVIRLVLGASNTQPRVATTVIVRATSAGSLDSQVGVGVRIG
jgi:hypothetical protein